MKSKAIIKLAVVALLVIVFSFLMLEGCQIPGTIYEFRPVSEVLSLGLDLRGGLATEYVATDTSVENFDTLMDSTVSVLRTRLTNAGFTEATIARQGTDTIRVEIPDVEDPEEVVSLIGTPAHLEIRDPEGNVVIEGKDIKSAQVGTTDGSQPSLTSSPVVVLEFTEEGAAAFAEATETWLGQSLGIYLDDQQISSPVVNDVITNGEAVISYDSNSGMSTEEQWESCETLALQITSGALPLDITEKETRAISPTLGVEAMQGAVLAGLIGLILIILFMIAVYRLPGVAASLALLIYILIVFVLLCEIPGVQLTLQGVAGILLGIGMAVDANVVLFERFREELHLGRSPMAALKFGYKNALSAILDSNITTLIAAGVLLAFGTGTIQGFATTLIISVVTSLFTAVFVSRFLLRQIINLNIQNLNLFSRPFREKKADKKRFTGHTRVCVGISCAIVVIALIMQVCGAGLNLGLDFTGGSLLTYAVGEDYDVNDVETILHHAGLTKFQITKSEPSTEELAASTEDSASAEAVEPSASPAPAEAGDEIEVLEYTEEDLAHDHDGDGIPDHTAEEHEAQAEEAEAPIGLLDLDKSSIQPDGMTDLQIRLSLVDETEGLEQAVTDAVLAALPEAEKLSYGPVPAESIVDNGWDTAFTGGYLLKFDAEGEEAEALQASVLSALEEAGIPVENVLVTRIAAETEEAPADEASATEEPIVTEEPVSEEAAAAEQTDSEADVAEQETGKTYLAVLVSLNDQTTRVRSLLESEMRLKYENFHFISIDHVSAVAGRDLISNAVKTLVIAFACMLIYIAIRFDLFSGLAALLALIHDVLIMYAFMVFFRGIFQVNSPFIAAILTIIGYSINNTIIIFDRIRELSRKPGLTQTPRMEIVELSVSQTLSRTVNTSLTTLITLVCLFIFGVSSIREFAFPLIIGMLAGSYSSIMLSGQIWTALLNRFGKKQPRAQKSR